MPTLPKLGRQGTLGAGEHVQVGRSRPRVEGLYFAGDTYGGRRLALNSAALSGKTCVEKVLEKYGK